MAWVWNRRIFAWTTQVVLSGKFVMTREEVANGTVVSRAACIAEWGGFLRLTLPTVRRVCLQPGPVQVNSETLEPVTSGELNLFSAWYPGPGFTGGRCHQSAAV
jgi:hypothetical protein